MAAKKVMRLRMTCLARAVSLETAVTVLSCVDLPVEAVGAPASHHGRWMVALLWSRERTGEGQNRAGLTPKSQVKETLEVAKSTLRMMNDSDKGKELSERRKKSL